MRILHVVTFYNESRSYGGPLTVALNLAREQESQGHRVSFLALGDETKSYSKEGVNFYIFKFRKIAGLFRFSSMHSFRSCIWLLKNANKFEIIHMHFSRDIFQVVAALILRARRVAFFLQTHNMLTNPEANRKPLQSVFDALFVKKSVSSSKMVFALHDFEKNALAVVFPKAIISILANGVHFPDLPLNAIQGSDIVFISRLHPQKNPMLFIEAAELLIREGLEAQFLVAGPDGGLLSQVKAEISRVGSDQLKYLGAVNGDEVSEILSKSALLVLPSLNDAFPMIVLEALSHGVPVVVTSSCQISSTVQNLGLGDVCEPNLDSLRASIIELIEKPLDRQEVYEVSKKVFNLSEIVGGLTATYESYARKTS